MQITIDIPEDLVAFVENKAQQKTIPVIFYAQMAVVEFFRNKKEDEEFELEERNRPQVDETLTEEDRQEFEERKLRRQQREEKEDKMLEYSIEALQSFTKSMNAHATLVEGMMKTFNADSSGN